MGKGADMSDRINTATEPTSPQDGTHRAAILAALRAGEHLTHIEALRRGWG